jgi:hypothetical protein
MYTAIICYNILRPDVLNVYDRVIISIERRSFFLWHVLTVLCCEAKSLC